MSPSTCTLKIHLKSVLFHKCCQNLCVCVPRCVHKTFQWFCLFVNLMSGIVLGFSEQELDEHRMCWCLENSPFFLSLSIRNLDQSMVHATAFTVDTHHAAISWSENLVPGGLLFVSDSLWLMGSCQLACSYAMWTCLKLIATVLANYRVYQKVLPPHFVQKPQSVDRR
jgi:hypothetical protein